MTANEGRIVTAHEIGNKIMIDRRAINEYLELIREKELPANLFIIVDIDDDYPIQRINSVLNKGN